MKSLKELREAKMMTQTEVAAALGISHVTVSKAELGKGVPHGRTIRGLAVLFDVDALELRDELQKQEGRIAEAMEPEYRIEVSEERIKLLQDIATRGMANRTEPDDGD